MLKAFIYLSIYLSIVSSVVEGCAAHDEEPEGPADVGAEALHLRPPRRLDSQVVVVDVVADCQVVVVDVVADCQVVVIIYPLS